DDVPLGAHPDLPVGLDPAGLEAANQAALHLDRPEGTALLGILDLEGARVPSAALLDEHRRVPLSVLHRVGIRERATGVASDVIPGDLADERPDDGPFHVLA